MIPDSRCLHFSGHRYWTASLLPALVGTVLPFWLRPSSFTFRWVPAIEFLVATALVHAGFSLLHARVERGSTNGQPEPRLLGAALVCIMAACLLGMHLNRTIPGIIFVVYGVTTIFAGVLYVAPPFSFHRRVGGEVVLAEGLGMLPVLGAYLVQIGDLTRTVYVASLPIVVATGLWVWVGELASRADDERRGRETMVRLFPGSVSGRLAVLALSMLIHGSLVVAVISASVGPFALATLLLLGLTWRIMAASWDGYGDQVRMREVCADTVLLHSAVCTILAGSSLVPLLL